MPPKKYDILAEISERMLKKPVLVGGSAVDLYTLGGYSSIDLDVVADRKELVPVLRDMGFKEDGRYFRRKDEFIDIVGSDLRGRRVSTITLKDSTQKFEVLSVEDTIVDRLCACKFWGNRSDCEQAKFLYDGYKDKLDREYLRRRVLEEDVAEAERQWLL